MQRKKWTAKTQVTDADLKFREKRKWQIALRRYVLERQPTPSYAPFFGLSIEKFRDWIEIQFDSSLGWDNFSLSWQFDHVIPVTYFDFDDERELQLCWNFTNIRIEKLESNVNRGNRLDMMGAKVYFETLFLHTQLPICNIMLAKIEQLESSSLQNTRHLESFIRNNRQYIDDMSSFSAYEFQQLNSGIEWKEVMAEKALMEKFGK